MTRLAWLALGTAWVAGLACGGTDGVSGDGNGEVDVEEGEGDQTPADDGGDGDARPEAEGGDSDADADADGDDDAGPCEAGGVELCNGLDDDCDTLTDEDFDCRRGLATDCPTSCGSTGRTRSR